MGFISIFERIFSKIMKNELTKSEFVAIVHECAQVNQTNLDAMRDEIEFLKECVRAERDNTKLAVDSRNKMEESYKLQIQAMREQIRYCEKRYDNLIARFHLENEKPSTPQIINDNRTVV